MINIDIEFIIFYVYWSHIILQCIILYYINLTTDYNQN